MASRLKTGLRYARRYPLPIGAGAAVVGFLQFRRITQSPRGEETPATLVVDEESFYIPAYKLLPLCSFSRLWGKVNNLDLPVWSRPWLLGAYSKLFGCDLNEAKNPDLSCYPNLGSFFHRQLRDGVRPIDPTPGTLASPCDGKVLTCTRLQSDQDKVEQVKGMTFSLKQFLGQTPDLPRHKSLYCAVIYLAPGDYHGFHAPSYFSVFNRIHFSGLLLSVSPWAARNVSSLFNINERVAYSGVWDDGQFMSLTAVGATNVGCVKVACDSGLSTNVKDKTLWQKKAASITAELKKGDYFGEFNLGSTIVLVFEAPETFEFIVGPGDTVKMGQRISKMK